MDGYARSSLVEGVRSLWDGLLSLVYPPRCAVCLELGTEVVCRRCHEAFTVMPEPVCRACGAFLGTSPDSGGARRYCHECLNLAPYHFRWARARGVFDGTLRTAIHRLKYDGRRAVAAVLGEWMRDPDLPPLLPPGDPDVVVPVPLHRSRHRERGFNQSELLARAFVAGKDWPVDTKALLRTRNTRPQVALKPEERASNVRNAFAAPDPERVRGRRVLLVDDVLTTLHTVAECSRVLREAGAAEVLVVAVAR